MKKGLVREERRIKKTRRRKERTGRKIGTPGSIEKLIDRSNWQKGLLPKGVQSEGLRNTKQTCGNMKNMTGKEILGKEKELQLVILVPKTTTITEEEVSKEKKEKLVRWMNLREMSLKEKGS